MTKLSINKYFFTTFFTFALFLSTFSFASADITTGLIGYWSFDDGSGTMASDLSGNGNTGTLVNGPAWITGKIGGALQLDGSDDYVTLGSPASLNITDNITLSAWLNADSLHVSGNRIISMDNGSTGDHWSLSISLGSPERWDFRINNSFAPYDSAVNEGQWYHFVGTYDGSNRRWYIDGTLVKTLATTGAISTGQNITIGTNDNSPDRFFDGLIDDVRIYNRALSQAEITELYNVGANTTPPPTCTSFTYSEWGTCQSNNTQTRSITSLLPSGCSGGAPLTTQSCTYIPPPPDNTSPSTPTNLSAAAISSSQINLSWNASTDNVGVAGYRIYRNGSQIITTAGTSYSNTGLSPSTTYIYTVSAYDAQGNNSSQSVQASATTNLQLPSTGTIYYVDDDAANDSGDGSINNPKKYITSAIKLLSGGDTLIIKDGIYTGLKNMVGDYASPQVWPPSGLGPNQYTVIKAENIGKAVIDGEYQNRPFSTINREAKVNYVRIEGIYFRGSSGGGLFNIKGDYNKVIKCGFEDGQSPNIVNRRAQLPLLQVVHHILWLRIAGFGGRDAMVYILQVPVAGRII